MATITDISKHTGYSLSTVASVLRGATNFREDTRQKVQNAARELDYQPNWLSKALAGASSMTIGVFGSRIDVPSSMKKIVSIENVARKADFLTYIVSSPIFDFESQQKYLKNLLSRRIDGLIFNCLPQPPNGQILKMLENVDIPVVFMDMVPKGRKNCVSVNRVNAIVETVSCLESLGHKKIALIAHELEIETNDLKIAAYKQAAKVHDIELLPIQDWAYQRKAINFEKDAYALITKKFKEIKNVTEFPTTLITFDDDIAVAAIKALNDIGLSVPGDISVVGFDDSNIASFSSPALTTIRQPRSEVGKAAANMLLKMINNPEEPIMPAIFDAELIIRESTGPVRQTK